MLEAFLTEQGYNVVGIAISYEEAVELYTSAAPDIALIDIRLNSIKNGIDFAEFLNEQESRIPFIFLTSQLDHFAITKAKVTLPAGYLGKPIQKESLFATMQLAMHASQQTTYNLATILLSDGQFTHVVSVSEIQYVKAAHVYIEVYDNLDRPKVVRKPLGELIQELPSPPFIQCHRSYIVNVQFITKVDSKSVWLGDVEIPMSRNRSKGLLKYL